MTAAKLETKINRSGKENFAVSFEHNGRPYSTMWTYHREEAIAWGRAIQQTGWCVSARPFQTYE